MDKESGLIELLLTPKLYQISLEYFLDLLIAIVEEGDDRKSIRKEW